MHRLRKVVGLERLDKHATCSVIVHGVCLQGFASTKPEPTMEFGWVRSCLLCTLRVVEDWLFVSSDIVAPIFLERGDVMLTQRLCGY